MTNYAVLIGNSEFPNEPSLKPLICPPFDVDGLKSVLTAENCGQFLAENVSILKNRANLDVFQELEKLFDNATKDDLVLLYYSGHGLQDRHGNLHLSTFNTNAELLKSTAVSFNRIYEELIKTAYCKKIIVILDCCYSGIAGNVFKSDIGSQLQSVNDKVTGTFLITSTTNDTVAVDKTDDSSYSLFTKHLINALKTDEADTNGDGLISIDELFRYVSKKVMDENPNQKPKRFVNNETGEMIVGKSGHNSRKESADDIKRYFATLFADDLIEIEILQAVSQLIYKSQFSELEQQQYDLVVAVFKSKKLAGFERKWHNLLSQPDLPGFKNLEGLKPEPPVIIAPSKTIVEPSATWLCPVTGMEFVYINPGTFMMGGSPETEKGRRDDERRHQVTIEKGFYLGKYLVTQAQWQQVMGNNPSHFKGNLLAVETISWNDIQEFLQKLNAKTGKNYRLPTEAEWEYVCYQTSDPVQYCSMEKKNIPVVDWEDLMKEAKETLNYYNYATNPSSWRELSYSERVKLSQSQLNKKEEQFISSEWTCSDYSENYDGYENHCSTLQSDQRTVRGMGGFGALPIKNRPILRSSYNTNTKSKSLSFRVARDL